VVGLQLLSLSVMVPSKSVKKMILGCALRVSGNGIVNEGTEVGCRNNRGKVDRDEKKRGGKRERTKITCKLSKGLPIHVFIRRELPSKLFWRGPAAK
jgi:hypothetical protein